MSILAASAELDKPAKYATTSVIYKIVLSFIIKPLITCEAPS